jgi:hypothetical protein
MSNDVDVIVYIPEPNTPWKICLPTAILHNTVRWYHMSLNRIGMTRTYDTMSMYLYHEKLKNVLLCEDLIGSCNSWQRFRLLAKAMANYQPEILKLLPGTRLPWILSVHGKSQQWSKTQISSSDYH